MIADNRAFDSMIETVARNAPISEDYLRQLFPVGTIINWDILMIVAAMARCGLCSELINAIVEEYKRLGPRFVEELTS